MTNPNWWDVEPFSFYDKKWVGKLDSNSLPVFKQYSIEAIIAEVEKRGETTVEDCGRYNECRGCFGQFHDDDVNFCPHCGAKIIWS